MARKVFQLLSAIVCVCVCDRIYGQNEAYKKRDEQQQKKNEKNVWTHTTRTAKIVIGSFGMAVFKQADWMSILAYNGWNHVTIRRKM